MTDEAAYWQPVCALARDLRCWNRFGPQAQGHVELGLWGRLLIVPTAGYLEGPDGPPRMADVAFVDLATERPRIGPGHELLELVGIEAEIVERLAPLAAAKWARVEDRWSIDRVVSERPNRVIRIFTPLR